MFLGDEVEENADFIFDNNLERLLQAVFKRLQ